MRYIRKTAQVWRIDRRQANGDRVLDGPHELRQLREAQVLADAAVPWVANLEEERRASPVVELRCFHKRLVHLESTNF